MKTHREKITLKAQQAKAVRASLYTGVLLALSMVLPGQAHAAQVIAEDLIVQGSTCTGFDCAASESFGFDTLRMKENNLRIHFDDTSSSASFPANDWRIAINDTSNGGANYFAIEDATLGRQVFKVQAGAPNNALVVNSAGRLGVKTDTPVVDIHVVEGNSPTLRLEQDGSDGFTQQTWDLAGNEANFFVRDVTNGTKLPFKIKPGAPTDSLFIKSDGHIGFGTDNPLAGLHINETSGSNAEIRMDVDDGTGGDYHWEIKSSVSTGRLTFKELNSGTTPMKFASNAANNLFRVGVTATDTVDIGGNLIISGQCTEADGACADYVFEPDYELRSLDELQTFIKTNKHLPNVPSAEQMETHGVNIANISGRLLEKIEELTLYTLQQEEMIDTLGARLQLLESQSNSVVQ